MSWSENDLREAFRKGVKSSKPSTPCPEPNLLGRLLLDEASADEREHLADHLETCSRCASLLQDLRPLESWSERAARINGGRSFAPAKRWPVALAATLLLTIGAGWLWSHFNPSMSRVPAIERSTSQAVEPPDGARLHAPPHRFDWPDMPGATGYRLRLFDDSAKILWESTRLDHSELLLTDEVVAELETGASYSWQVDIDGPVKRSRFGPFWFSL